MPLLKNLDIIVYKRLIIFALIIGVFFLGMSCKRHLKINEAKTLADSIAVYADVTQYKTTFLKEGVASWYGADWNGRNTASGDIFNNQKFSAASATIPLGTFLKVTHLKNKKVVFVKVNDTFPTWNTRILDLSEGAARSIDMILEGVAKVKVEVVIPVKK